MRLQGKTVNGVARQIGVSGRAVRAYLRGKEKVLAAQRVKLLAAEVGLSVRQLEAKILREWA
jgi:predicted transcriptional regulator